MQLRLEDGFPAGRGPYRVSILDRDRYWGEGFHDAIVGYVEREADGSFSVMLTFPSEEQAETFLAALNKASE